MDRDELGPVWERPLDLYLPDHLADALHHIVGRENTRAKAHHFGDGSSVADQLENLRRDERDGFRMVAWWRRTS